MVEYAVNNLGKAEVVSSILTGSTSISADQPIAARTMSGVSTSGSTVGSGLPGV